MLTCTVNSSRYPPTPPRTQIFHELHLKAASLQVVEGREEVKSKSWIWIADLADGARNQGGFSAPCPCTRGAPKRAPPPHLWQLLWPDGGNLERWVGPVEHREERERMKEEKGGGGAAEEGSENWFHQRGPIHGTRTDDNGGASQTRRWGGQKHNQKTRLGRNGVKEESDLSVGGSR